MALYAIVSLYFYDTNIKTYILINKTYLFNSTPIYILGLHPYQSIESLDR